MFTLMEDDQIGRICSDFEECGKNQCGIFFPMQDTNTVCIFEPLRPIFNLCLRIYDLNQDFYTNFNFIFYNGEFILLILK